MNNKKKAMRAISTMTNKCHNADTNNDIAKNFGIPCSAITTETTSNRMCLRKSEMKKSIADYFPDGDVRNLTDELILKIAKEIVNYEKRKQRAENNETNISIWKAVIRRIATKGYAYTLKDFTSAYGMLWREVGTLSEDGAIQGALYEAIEDLATEGFLIKQKSRKQDENRWNNYYIIK